MGEAKAGRRLSSLDVMLSRPTGYQQCSEGCRRRETDEKRGGQKLVRLKDSGGRRGDEGQTKGEIRKGETCSWR